MHSELRLGGGSDGLTAAVYDASRQEIAGVVHAKELRAGAIHVADEVSRRRRVCGAVGGDHGRAIRILQKFQIGRRTGRAYAYVPRRRNRQSITAYVDERGEKICG